MIKSAESLIIPNSSSEMLKDFGDINMEKLIDLNKNIKKGLAEHIRSEKRWENLLEKAFLIEDIISSRNSSERKIKSTFWIDKKGFFHGIMEQISNKKTFKQKLFKKLILK